MAATNARSTMMTMAAMAPPPNPPIGGGNRKLGIEKQERILILAILQLDEMSKLEHLLWP